MILSRPEQRLVRAALTELGVERLALQVHDASLPAAAAEDVGSGAPASDAAAAWFGFAAELGFDTIQLGPQGATVPGNASPYDATLFSRSPLAIALAPLQEEGLVPARLVTELVAARPRDRGRTHLRSAQAAMARALEAAWESFAGGRRGRWRSLDRELAAYRRREAHWLLRDALYERLCVEHGGDWRQWRDGETSHPDRRLFSPEPGEEPLQRRRLAALRRRHAGALERYAFVQYLAHRQHAAVRARCARLGLRLYADLHIGFSLGDAWSARALFLRGYRMGAPPSRTNPDGQPWGFPVLHPGRYGTAGAGPVLRFLDRRLAKLRREYDGLRIDHPHGWVCPWVYRAGTADASAAVRAGARLFGSPHRGDHPELQRFALVRPDQIDADRPEHDDRHIRELEPEQVAEYARLFDRLAGARRGRHGLEIVCEVLSTLPLPLARVIERHGLGRFRVLQKADPDDPADVYRADNARAEDWIMLGNHDTPPIWAVVAAWRRDGRDAARIRDLAQRLEPRSERRPAFAARLARRPGALVQALFADLLASRARHALVFFPDLLGLRETYNAPGTVSDANWSLRIPPDFVRVWRRGVARGQALNLPAALALALRSRGAAEGRVAGLERIARRLERPA